MRGRIAVLLAAASALGGCIKKPQVILADIKIGGINFQKIDLVCLFRVNNPNWFDASVYSFDYSMSVGGQPIAQGRLPQPIPKVPAYGNEIIPVAASIDFNRLSRIVRQARAGNSVSYKLSGRPVFNMLGLPVPVPVTHAGRMPSLLAPRWKLRGVGLRSGPKPAFLLTFEIENPGKRDLSLVGLKGSLKLNGQTVLQIYETSVTKLPSGKKVRIVIPVRLGVAAMYRAAKRAMANQEALKFDGEFKLKTPASMREMLLGQEKAKRPGRPGP